MDALNRTLLDMLARAEADPYYADIPLFVMRPRLEADGTAKSNASFALIQERIDSALNCLVVKAGKGGAAVTFLMPIGDTTRPNVEGPELRMVYTARVQEHPILNFGPKGTGKTAEEIALHTLQLFHLCMLNGRNCLGADPSTLTPSAEFAPVITYDVRLFQPSNLARPAKVALPIITRSGAVAPVSGVTIACATSGAAIWYTLDGSYPSSANPEATQYSGAFNVAAACTLRAAAEKSGVQQSDVAQAIFT